MGLADTDANNMLGVRFGGRTSNVPATYAVALSSTPPNDDGTNVTEPSGGGYARVSFANNSTNWSTPASRIVSNAVKVTFPTATANWTGIQYWCLFDSSSGRLCAAGRFAGAATVPAGSPAVIEVGGLRIRVPASTITL